MIPKSYIGREYKKIKCLVDDCEKEVGYGGRRGYCKTHYERLKRTGVLERQRSYGENWQKHPLYSVYTHMKERCYRPKNQDYHNYGGRGIEVCDRWLDRLNGFPNFVSDMGERPDGMTLDRIDVDSDYSPENCRWATPHQQSANRKNSRPVVGVSPTKRGKYTARLMVNRQYVLLKEFDTYEKAVAARRQAELDYGIIIS